MPVIPAGELALIVHALLGDRQGPAGQSAPGQDRHCLPAHWPLPGAWDVLAQRRAVRQFTSESVALRDVLTIAEQARDAEHAIWPAAVHGDIDYTILIAAFRVAGLEPGLYLAGREPASVPFPELDELRTAYADAACLLLICADISAAGPPDGPEYGPLLIRAGTIGYGAWLTAIRLGLAGCVYAAAHHQVTAAARLVDARLNHVFTASAGRRS